MADVAQGAAAGRVHELKQLGALAERAIGGQGAVALLVVAAAGALYGAYRMPRAVEEERAARG